MENISKSAQEAAARIPQITQNAADSLGKAVQNLAENLAPIMDRLAGTQSTVKLSFDNLTLDTGTAKAKITGSINLEVSYTDQQQKGAQAPASDATQVDRTVVTNVAN